MATRKDFSVSLDFGNDPIFSAVRDASGSMKSVLANSVNRTATWSRTEAERRIGRGLALPAGYISKKGMLGATRASYLKPTAKIIAGFRPMQLRSYALNAPAVFRDRQRPKVEVTPGRQVSMTKAFFIKMRGGSQTGIAMKHADYLQSHKGGASKPFNGIVLLHGPSIDQHFSLVSEDMQEEILRYLREEVIDELKRKGLI